VKEFFFLVLVS